MKKRIVFFKKKKVVTGDLDSVNNLQEYLTFGSFEKKSIFYDHVLLTLAITFVFFFFLKKKKKKLK